MSTQLSEIGMMRLAVNFNWGTDQPPTRELVLNAWRVLDQTECEALSAHMGLDGLEPMGLKELAKSRKWTQSQTRQRLDAIRAKLLRAVAYLTPKAGEA